MTSLAKLSTENDLFKRTIQACEPEVRESIRENAQLLTDKVYKLGELGSLELLAKIGMLMAGRSEEYKELLKEVMK
jgi:hypothetical protein